MAKPVEPKLWLHFPYPLAPLPGVCFLQAGHAVGAAQAVEPLSALCMDMWAPAPSCWEAVPLLWEKEGAEGRWEQSPAGALVQVGPAWLEEARLPLPSCLARVVLCLVPGCLFFLSVTLMVISGDRDDTNPPRSSTNSIYCSETPFTGHSKGLGLSGWLAGISPCPDLSLPKSLLSGIPASPLGQV